MSDEIERKGLTEVEIALADALKTVLEIIIHAHPGAEKFLARSLRLQRDKKLEIAQPDAAAVFELLRQFVADQVRQTNREEVRRILEEPPKGRA